MTHPISILICFITVVHLHSLYFWETLVSLQIQKTPALFYFSSQRCRAIKEKLTNLLCMKWGRGGGGQILHVLYFNEILIIYKKGNNNLQEGYFSKLLGIRITNQETKCRRKNQ